ncbi:MAG: NAD(P)-dependent alcohol dehydrogenase [Candidatus Limnocylindrales bacterium]
MIQASQLAQRSKPMLAIVQERYGASGVLKLEEREMPVIGDDGVLVQVRASSVNAVDWHTIRGRPFVARFGSGVLRPKQVVPGTDVAGVVVAVGKDVTEFRPGDEVFGARSGAYAAYVAGRLRNFVWKPANLTFEQAAAIPVAAITALQGLRDKGHVQAGQRVLVLGGGGGVGSFAVQLAKAFGAEVTASTSMDKLEMVRAMGADEVIDYTRQDPTKTSRRYDLVLDVGGYASLRALARAATPDGTIVNIGAGKASLPGIVIGLVAGGLRSRFGRQRVVNYLARIQRDDLLVLAEMTAADKIRAFIDRTYPLREADAAVSYAETGQASGKVVITV